LESWVNLPLISERLGLIKRKEGEYPVQREGFKPHFLRSQNSTLFGVKPPQWAWLEKIKFIDPCGETLETGKGFLS